MTNNLRSSEVFFKADERNPTIKPKSKRLQVGFKRLSESAVIPTKAHASDSGFDLVASEDIIIEPGETAVVPTGIAVDLPAGYEAQVRPRSGVTAKTKLRVQLGTIDNGFNGVIGVIVDNISGNESSYTSYVYRDVAGGLIDAGHVYNGIYYEIKRGDRIAQLVIQPLPIVEAVEVFDVEETERGEGGFGSTGVREENGKCSYCKNEIAGTPKTADNVICKTCGDIMTQENNR